MYVDRPPDHVSLLARDIAGNFVHHLKEKQLSHLIKRLEPTRGKDYGHYHHHHSREDGLITVGHLKDLLHEIHVMATRSELRALAACLSANDNDHFSMSDTTSSRLHELANDPHLHVWSSEEWHVALKEERRKTSEAAHKADYELRLHKEKIKLHRLDNVKKKLSAGGDKNWDVHEKARKHLAKIERQKRRVYEKKWKRVQDNKKMTHRHKEKMVKQGHVHIEFERIMFRLRQGKLDASRLFVDCELEDESNTGMVRHEFFLKTLQSCCVGTTVTKRERQVMSTILDPDNTGRVCYEDFSWVYQRQRGANGFTLEIKKKQSSMLMPVMSTSPRSSLDTRRSVTNEPGGDFGGAISEISMTESEREERTEQLRHSLQPSIVIVGIVQAAGVDATNTAVRVGLGRTARSTESRWNSDAPVFNELWTCLANGKSPISVTLLEHDSQGKTVRPLG